MRSGHFNLTNTAGTFRFAGNDGNYWSSRAASTTGGGNNIPSVYYLFFNATTVTPSVGPWQRWYSRSLRCLSTVLDI